MKKSTPTPDSATPDHAPDPVAGQEMIIPTGPVRIFSALQNEKYFLSFHSDSDNIIRLFSGATTLFPFWLIQASPSQGAYYFKSYTAELNLDATLTLQRVTAKPINYGIINQNWYILDAGDGLVYIQSISTDKVLTVYRSGAEHGENDSVGLSSRGNFEMQKFRLGAKPT